MGYTSKNPKFDSVIYTDLMATTPQNPASGSYKLLNRGGAFFVRSPAGTETSISGSASISANIRPTEGAGTTTLTSADVKFQRFDLSAARTVVLPSTGVLQGEIWDMINPNGFQLTIQASDASTICLNWGAEFMLVALIATPVTSADWAVISKSVLYGSAWMPYTPTFTSFGTVGASFFRWRRSGMTEMEIRGDFVSGTPAGASGYLSLPLNLNIDTTEIDATRQNKLGEYFNRTTMTSDMYQANVAGFWIYDSGGGSQQVAFSYNASTNLYNAANVNGIITAGDNIDVPFIKVPILEWAEI